MITPQLPIIPQDFPLIGLLKYFDEPPGSRGLELGANDNFCSAILQLAGYDMTGIDSRPFEVEREVLKGVLDRPNWKQVLSTVANARPLIAPPYDFIVSLSAIEHFGLAYYPGDSVNPNADAEAMDLAFEWLKPGGRAYITVPVGISKQTEHWRRYSQAEIRDRIIRKFKVELIHNLWSWDAPECSLMQAFEWSGVGCNYEPLFILKKQ